MEGAAEQLKSRGLGHAALIGPGGIAPESDPRLGSVSQILRARWPERVRDGIHALDLAVNPLLFATGLVALGEFDVCMSGTAVPVDSIEEAARWVIGEDRARKGRGSLTYVSASDERLLLFAAPDAAGPLDAKGLAQLALTAAIHRKRASGEESNVAFLVASPTQDASHADAELALAELRAMAPALSASVEWDWSTSADGPGRPRFRSRPNVLIFPDPITAHLAQLVLRDAAGLPTWGPMYPGDTWVLAGIVDGAIEDIVTVAALAGAGLTGL